MKKLTYLVALATTLLFNISCSEETIQDSIEQQRENLTNADVPITFDTYMGRAGQTRAGYEGSIGNSELKDAKKSNGFGVFAYYTGTKKYNDAQYYDGGKVVSNDDKLAANFMFNQQVKWDNSSNVWTYSPIKYWPNEIANGAVDVQTDPAKGASANGGYVSFFAYAPYVGIDGTGLNGTATSTTDYGITEINGKTTLTEANAVKGDPTITYKIGSKFVDLLWGTLDASSTEKNVVNNGNTGVKGSSTGTTDFEKAIVANETVAADLTKQTVSGKVGFKFKHALSKVGGATKTNDKIDNNSGLMVVLDIDKDGNETGGTKDANTVVTIKEITIKQKGTETTSEGTTTTSYVTGGTLNLATGQWTTTPESLSDAPTQSIKSNATGTAPKLATSIAEPTSVTTMEKSSSGSYLLNPTDSEEGIEGVTTTKKNVYADDAAPFVFIPGTKPSFTITVTYVVRTFDSNLATWANGEGETETTGEGESATTTRKGGTWTKVEQAISKDVTFDNAVEMNKRYSLLMHLGLTSVKFTAEVADWEDANPTSGSSGSSTTDVPLTEVYLPINVKSTSSSGSGE